MSNQEKDEKTYLFDKPRNVTHLLRGFYIICTILFVADLIVHRHSIHPWEGFPGFYAIYGFVACVVLVVIAKEMRKVLMRKEDYYDKRNDEK
ncbi:MAG: hypothetical protein OQK95_13845 [Gammaproteobacteria bacterium]|nr:hypothetical protein [Gammaproteobacteria bacterium]